MPKNSEISVPRTPHISAKRGKEPMAKTKPRKCRQKRFGRIIAALCDQIIDIFDQAQQE